MSLLSVIVPVYNEAKTVRKIIDKINDVPIEKEIIIVNDGSEDGTGRILKDIPYKNIKVIHHSSNRGKGAAFLTGLANSTGDYVIIQDADLEYDPGDYLALLGAIQKDNVDIVLGARFTKGFKGLFFHCLGNRVVTGLINLLYGSQLNDAYTCYKLFKREKILGLNLKAATFDIEAEIVAKAIKNKLAFSQVPVAYYPRSYKEGKKIRWFDGVKAITAIIKYRFQNE